MAMQPSPFLAARNDRIIAMSRDGFANNVIGHQMKLSAARVWQILDTAGCIASKRRRMDWTADHDIELQRMWGECLNTAKIGVALGFGKETVRQRAVELKLPKRGRGNVRQAARRGAGRPFAADHAPSPQFVADLMLMSHAQLEKAHGVTNSTIRRWIGAMPDDIKQARTVARRDTIRADNRQAALTRWAETPRTERAEQTHKARVAKVVKRRAAPVNWGFNKPIQAADIPGGMAQRAVDFLKLHYKPSFNAARVYGKAWAGVFVVGREKVDETRLLAMAAAKGWAPDAWRVVA